MVTVRVY